MSVVNNRCCAACGDQWKTRASETFDTGVKSQAILLEMQMPSDYGRKTIQFTVCDKHFRNSRQIIRYTQKGNILKIRNVIKNSWRTAEKVGVVV